MVQLGLRVVQAPGARPPVGAAVHRRRPVPVVGAAQRVGDQVERGVPVDLDERVRAPAPAPAFPPRRPHRGPHDAVARVHRAGNRVQQLGRVAVGREGLRRDEPAVFDARVESAPVRAVDGHGSSPTYCTTDRTAKTSVGLTTASPVARSVHNGRTLELFPPGSAVAADGTLTVAGCRADELAAEFGTPVLVVAESALRDRAREYRTELAARWPNSRVVFASKAFPCTAVQRVMVEEGLGLDVAGGGEIRTALKAGVDPALIVLHGNAKSVDELDVGRAARDRARGGRRARRRRPARGARPTRRQPGRARAGDPRRHSRRARARHDRARGLQVRPRAARRRGVDRPHRAQRPDHGARAARARRIADPRHRAVRPFRRADRGASARSRSTTSAVVSGPATATPTTHRPSPSTSTPSSARRANTSPATRR